MRKSSKLRVIVDTNCWISFLIGRRLSVLVDLLSNEVIQLVVCDELLEELREVTGRPKFKKYFPKDKVDSLIEFMQLIGEHFEPQRQVQLCRDAADDYLLALAIEAKAHYLVTGDEDLLILRKIETCHIVDAKTFVQAVSIAN